MTRLVIDISNWTGTLDFTQVARLKEAGVTGAVVGTQTPLLSSQQIESLEAGGIPVEAVYCFLYWDTQDTGRVVDALSFQRPVWLDCEYVTNPMPSSTDIINRIDKAVGQVRFLDQLAGLYTGGWWWPPYTGDTGRFKDLPLWHAAYQSRPESLHLPASYGGWTEAKMWQFSSSGLAGVNLDLSIAADAVTAPPSSPTQPTETEALRALARAGKIIAAGNENLADLAEVDKNSLKWMVAQL